MCSESTWSKARHAKSLHLALLGLCFAFARRHALDLRLVDGTSLHSRRAIHIDFQSTLDMPLYSLAQPAIMQALAHLEAYDLMARL